MKQVIKLLKSMYMLLWKKIHDNQGNVHLNNNEAKLKKIPFSKSQIFIRPSSSDMGRIGEYVAEIYFNKSYLHDKLKSKKPRVLFDIGANIGTSTLSLVNEFSSLKEIYGIEAEFQNHGVLKKNYDLWNQEFSDKEFIPIHAVATSSSEDKIFSQSSLHELTGVNTASGTFRFTNTSHGSNKGTDAKMPVIGLNELMKNFSDDEWVICKMDIEGGEEYLLEKNTEWLSRVLFLTVEVHDRFHKDMMSSSKQLIKALCEHDFAIVPEKDILHCFSRKLFS